MTGVVEDGEPVPDAGVRLEPDRDRFCELVADARSNDGGQPTVVRVAAALPPGIEPVAAYAALTGRTTNAEPSPYAFLLESAGKTAGSDPDGAFRPSHATVDRHARYSFVGYDPDAVVTADPEGVEVTGLGADRYAELLEPDESLPEGADVLDQLRAAMPDVTLAGFPEQDRQHLSGGLVGFLAYDAVYDLWLDEVGVERPESRFPDAQFVLTTKTVVFDHAGRHEDSMGNSASNSVSNSASNSVSNSASNSVSNSASLVLTPVVDPDDDPDTVYDELEAEAERVATLLAEADDPEPGGFRRNREEAEPRDAYEDAVRRAKEHVRAGDIYQGVISRTRELYGDVDPLGLYAALREINPSPYMYLLGYDDLHVVGASPETLVSVSGDRVVNNPIAGTCPRGESPVEDRRLAGEMLADGKERAEHTMLVDLARNDVRRVCEPGSVRVEEFMAVLKYSHVQHIESTVTGTLAEDSVADPRLAARETGSPDAFDATRAAFPAGTLSGAPKIRAMEIIDELELTPRGPYGGGVGYYSWTGDADFAIVIRTATVEQLEDEARIAVQAGAGIVADSDPAAEYEETERKMDGVLAALERIEEVEPRVIPKEVSE